MFCTDSILVMHCQLIVIGTNNSILVFNSYFEKLAVGVLNESYTTDKSLTHRLLVRECTQWGANTVFSMADSGAQMDIMSQSACQTKLTKIWTGKMANHTPMYKVHKQI